MRYATLFLTLLIKWSPEDSLAGVSRRVYRPKILPCREGDAKPMPDVRKNDSFPVTSLIPDS
jgi:hypothetical protein